MHTATNPASSTPEIPHDLVCEILEHLEDDKPSLCAVSLSSSVLRHEAQTVLFRRATTLTTEKAHFRFCRTVVASPDRLALLVRAYEIAIPYVSMGLSNRIHKGLCVMHNLKDLRVQHLSDTTILHGCTSKLEQFQWSPSHRGADSPEGTALELMAFLYGKDMLKHLSIMPHGAVEWVRVLPFGWNIKLCPQLVSLVGNWEVIQAILPDHKISSMRILRITNILSWSPDEIDINSLVPAFKNIKVLSYCNKYSNKEDPQPHSILPHCISLTMLELGRFNIEKVFAVLPTLPALHTLVLTLYGQAFLAHKAMELGRRVFDNSSMNLKKIYVQVDEGTYERYMRSREEDDPIPRISRGEVSRFFAE